MEKEETQTAAKQNLLPRASETGQTVREETGPASHFQQGKQAGELVKGMFFFFSGNLQLTDSISDKNPRVSGQSLQREERLCIRPALNT